MPFSHVCVIVVVIANQLGQTSKMGIESNVVMRAAIAVRPGPRHKRRARRCAKRMSDVRLLEDKRLRSKLVQIRRVDFGSAIACDRVGPLLVRKKDEQIWFPRQFGWLCHDSGPERESG